jgi:hypothetical protein
MLRNVECLEVTLKDDREITKETKRNEHTEVTMLHIVQKILQRIMIYERA